MTEEITSHLYELRMPPSANNTERTSVPNDGVVVIVGANGSGKTRLGRWIETASENQPVHRLTAEKVLKLPERTTPTTNDSGAARHLGLEAGRQRRYDGDPAIGRLDDFSQLVQYLLSEQLRASVEYRNAARQDQTYCLPGETKLEAAIRIWESVFSARTLLVDEPNGAIRCTQETSTESYAGSMMSDGERVGFYLIGQCLVAKPGSVVIVDEPEIHLHKAIQSTLWDTIEAERSDCRFVYLTHDLDFAAGRVGAPKVCLREYDGTTWDWFVVPEDHNLPEELLLRILGSRKPILFVEGTSSSHDVYLYSLLYPQFAVVPCESCDHVVHATASFGAMNHLHQLECRGLVDRDHRTDEQVQRLNRQGIGVLEVAEIENALLVPGVLAEVAESLSFGDQSEQHVEQAKQWVLGQLGAEKERIATMITLTRLRQRYGSFAQRPQTQAELQQAWDGFVADVSIRALHAEALSYLGRICGDDDYVEALAVYPNKGLVSRIGTIFGLGRNGYINHIRRRIADGHGVAIIEAMRECAPTLDLADEATAVENATGTAS